jgi:hypothetical protein
VVAPSAVEGGEINLLRMPWQMVAHRVWSSVMSR